MNKQVKAYKRMQIKHRPFTKELRGIRAHTNAGHGITNRNRRDNAKAKAHHLTVVTATINRTSGRER